MPRYVVIASKVGEIQTTWFECAQSSDALLPLFRGKFRWRCRRPQMPRAIETYTSDVTREDRTGIRIVQRKVVIRVSRSVVCAQRTCTGAQIGAILENAEPFRWYRNHLTPERSHQIAVDSRRARHQLGRIYHVRCADRMYVQSRARQYTEQGSGTARM